MAEYVYLVGAFGAKAGSKCVAVKVGITNDIKGRLSSLQNGHHLPLAAISIWTAVDREAARHIERQAHVHFRGRRLCGEWFAPPHTEIMEFIDSMLGPGERMRRLPRRKAWYPDREYQAALRSDVFELRRELAEKQEQAQELARLRDENAYLKRKSEALQGDLERIKEQEKWKSDLLDRTQRWANSIVRGDGFVMMSAQA